VKPIGVKTKREKDLAWRVRLTLAFLIIFFSITVVEVFTGVRMSIFLQLLVSAIGSAIVTLTADKVGESVGGGLFGLRRATFTAREQLSADLDKIKFFKREARFDEALRLANEILATEPDFPEVLFLKAQILWEGFNNGEGAKQNLKRVLILAAEDEPLHRWALDLDRQLSENNE
jgi:hypothetical protein